uniref:Uncharacterized protein n=1 Tax=Bicosoecida sp. CB-2014 TaxID=1486930 RepID=A0A7S1CA94_9STRA|mmetsp:Transcript_19321/g.68303  ORF Transcript_19321/g.68303 Transcript_19321/m.68303 type:complete len:283 (+) Transcript_19321:190-1038(+)
MDAIAGADVGIAAGVAACLLCSCAGHRVWASLDSRDKWWDVAVCQSRAGDRRHCGHLSVAGVCCGLMAGILIIVGTVSWGVEGAVFTETYFLTLVIGVSASFCCGCAWCIVGVVDLNAGEVETGQRRRAAACILCGGGILATLLAAPVALGLYFGVGGDESMPGTALDNEEDAELAQVTIAGFFAVLVLAAVCACVGLLAGELRDIGHRCGDACRGLPGDVYRGIYPEWLCGRRRTRRQELLGRMDIDVLEDEDEELALPHRLDRDDLEWHLREGLLMDIGR